MLLRILWSSSKCPKFRTEKHHFTPPFLFLFYCKRTRNPRSDSFVGGGRSGRKNNEVPEKLQPNNERSELHKLGGAAQSQVYDGRRSDGGIRANRKDCSLPTTTLASSRPKFTFRGGCMGGVQTSNQCHHHISPAKYPKVGR
jgi:hypothetical protein